MPDLTHFDETGASRMVDVSSKEVTLRQTRAVGFVKMQSATLELIRNQQVAKGDVFEVARLAGIMATKRTAELIPLCHSLGLDSAEVAFEIVAANTVRIEATVPDSRGTALAERASELGLTKSQIIDEALALFLKVTKDRNG